MVIAGPCAIEDENQLLSISNTLKRLGIRYLRGGAFKHRTSPYSFAGLGKEGIYLIKKIADSNGQLVVSEITSESQIDLFAENVDIIQIGARSMRNYELIRLVAKLRKVTLLKRSMDSTLRDWLFAGEHFLYHGGQDLIFCERGVTSFDPAFRNMIDITSTCFIKEFLRVPVVLDPSHGTGFPPLFLSLIKAFLAIGIDGYMLEVHNVPEKALCDSDQALSMEEFTNIFHKITNHDTVNSFHE